jgi:hypothetical protein
MSETCQSCGYQMETANDHAPNDPHSLHCAYCSKPDGSLQYFDERFQRMTQWSIRKDGKSPEEAAEATRAYMRTMPLWKDHPALRTL